MARTVVSTQERFEWRDMIAGYMRCGVCCGPMNAYSAYCHIKRALMFDGFKTITTCSSAYCMKRGVEQVSS